ncbi:MAG: class I lanthipeptide [Bacteroidota bacterium]
MKKRNLQKGLKLQKETISKLSEKAVKGGITTSDFYGSRFIDLCFGVQTSYGSVCAIQCPPTTTIP